MYRKIGGLLPLGDVPRPDIYPAEVKDDIEKGSHYEQKPIDEDNKNEFLKSYKKDELPNTNNNNTTKEAGKLLEDKQVGNSTKASMNPTSSDLNNDTKAFLNNNSSTDSTEKPHDLNIEVSKTKSLNFNTLKNETQATKPSKRAHIEHNKGGESVLKRLKKTLHKIRKQKPKTERGGKKNTVIVNRPPVVYHPPPEIYHRPPLVLHRPPLLINRPSIVYHQPPVIVHRPAVIYRQPPLVFHQPPPMVRQPMLHSDDTFQTVPMLQHIGSHVLPAAHLEGTPPQHGWDNDAMQYDSNLNFGQGDFTHGGVVSENSLGFDGHAIGLGGHTDNSQLEFEQVSEEESAGDDDGLIGDVGGHQVQGLTLHDLPGAKQVAAGNGADPTVTSGIRKSLIRPLSVDKKHTKKHHVERNRREATTANTVSPSSSDIMSNEHTNEDSSNNNTIQKKSVVQGKDKKGTKKDVVVNRPPIIYHPPPEVYHRPDIVIHRPPIVIHRPPIIYHQPPVIVHRPAVVYHQPPIVFHQPPPAVQQPLLFSHDTFMVHPSFIAQHLGSVLRTAHHYIGPPRMLTNFGQPLYSGVLNQLGSLPSNENLLQAHDEVHSDNLNRLGDVVSNYHSATGIPNRFSDAHPEFNLREIALSRLQHTPSLQLDNGLLQRDQNLPEIEETAQRQPESRTLEMTQPNFASPFMRELNADRDEVPVGSDPEDLLNEPGDNEADSPMFKRSKIPKHKISKHHRQKLKEATGAKRQFLGPHSNIEFHNLHNGAHEIVVHRPGVVFHPPPEVIHRPNIVIHRAPLLIQRPPIIVHQPPVVIHRPQVYVHQPDVVFKTPPPVIHQPHYHSHDMYSHFPHLHHVHSDVEYDHVDQNPYHTHQHYGPAFIDGVGMEGHHHGLDGLSEEGLGLHGYGGAVSGLGEEPHGFGGAGSYGGLGGSFGGGLNGLGGGLNGLGGGLNGLGGGLAGLGGGLGGLGGGSMGGVLEHGVGFDDSALGFHHHAGNRGLSHGLYDDNNAQGVFDTQHEDYGNHEPSMRGSTYFDEGMGDVYGTRKYGQIKGLNHIGVGMSRSDIASQRRDREEDDDSDDDDSDDNDEHNKRDDDEPERRDSINENAYTRSIIIPQPEKSIHLYLEGINKMLSGLVLKIHFNYNLSEIIFE